MKHYDVYLFDWDGTLARTIEIWLEEIKRNYHAHGIPISDKENAKLFGNLNAPVLLGLPQEKLEAFTQKNQEAALARLPEAQLYDGVQEVLQTLRKAGKRTGIVTTSVPSTLQLVLDKHDLADFFDVTVTSADVRTHKPDPEGVLLALQRLGATPEQAVMFGDNEKDILAAHNAGVSSVLFYPDSHHDLYDLDDLSSHQPHRTIHHWREVTDWLQ